MSNDRSAKVVTELRPITIAPNIGAGISLVCTICDSNKKSQDVGHVFIPLTLEQKVRIRSGINQVQDVQYSCGHMQRVTVST